MALAMAIKEKAFPSVSFQEDKALDLDFWLLIGVEVFFSFMPSKDKD